MTDLGAGLMPQLELTDDELRLCLGCLAAVDGARIKGQAVTTADALFESLFEKVYRAYRGMPPKTA